MTTAAALSLAGAVMNVAMGIMATTAFAYLIVLQRRRARTDAEFDRERRAALEEQRASQRRRDERYEAFMHSLMRCPRCGTRMEVEEVRRGTDA